MLFFLPQANNEHLEHVYLRNWSTCTEVALKFDCERMITTLPWHHSRSERWSGMSENVSFAIFAIFCFTTRRHQIQTCGAFKCLYASSWGMHGLVHALCEVQALHKKQNNGLPSHKTHPLHQDEHDFENVLFCFFFFKKKERKEKKRRYSEGFGK